jgi:protoheme IX farnesyltransferase
VIFAIALEVAAFVLLTWQVNLLSAVLALVAMAFYVVVYTIWLKRTSTQNIVIGGAAEAVPVLVGWAAVTGSLLGAGSSSSSPSSSGPRPTSGPSPSATRTTTGAQRPHAPGGGLAGRRRSPDARLHRRALGVHARARPVAGLGWIYTVTAIVLGALFVGGCLGLLREPRRAVRCRSSPSRSPT